jgi:hypothetical protein
MADRVYVITKADGEIIRIRASKFDQCNLGSDFWSIDFYEEGKQNASAEVSVKLPYSVIPQDMIYESLQDSLIYPTISGADDEGVDFLGEALFSEADKKPFTLEERHLLEATLQSTKRVIQDKFKTGDSQQAEIDGKIDYLTKKVSELDKFNWKRLFISTLVGISVDLFFGTVVPLSLLSVFKETLSHLVEKGYKKVIGSKKELGKP